MFNFKIAAQTYTIREFMKTDEDFELSMKKLRDIGFSAVQLSAHHAVTPAKIADTLRKFDMECCITHTPLDKIQNEFDEVVKNHKSWNCKVVGIGGIGGEYTKNIEGYQKFVKIANEIGNKFAAEGMKFAYHNHAGEFMMHEGNLCGMDVFLDGFNENVEFIPDFYWLQYAGINVYEWILKLKNRVSTVHFKDYRISPKSGAPDFAEIGYGNMDYIKLSQICNEIDVKYAAIEQDSCPGDPFISLEKSLNYLKGIDC